MTKKEVAIKDLTSSFFARKELNEDRVIFFGELYEKNVEVDPITAVENTFEVIDGRHRIAGAELVGKETIVAILAKQQARPKLIAAALEANYGGALPPSRADIDYVIRQLIAEKVPVTKICELLAFIPEEILRMHVREVKKREQKRKVTNAISRVVDGATVFEAAREFDIDPKEIKARLGRKNSEENGSALFGDDKKRVLQNLRSMGSGIGKTLGNTFPLIESGEVSLEDAQKFAEEIGRRLKLLQKRNRDWLKRFETLKQTL